MHTPPATPPRRPTRSRSRTSNVRVVALSTALLTMLALLAGPPATADPEGPVALVSATPAGEPGDDQSSSPAISADGRYVTFASEASDLTPETDANAVFGGSDTYTYDRTTGEVTLVSRAAGGGATGAGTSINPVMTPDGRYIAFSSRAPDLYAGQGVDGENDPDVFTWDRTTGEIQIVSRQFQSTSPCTAGAAGSLVPSISDDGRYIAFQSDCGDLTADNDDNGLQDVFLWDRTTQAVTNLTFRGTASDNPSQNPRVSGDGSVVVFSSTATNISPAADTNGERDIYLHRLATGVNAVISFDFASNPQQEADGSSFGAHVSRDGQYVVYETLATNITPEDDTNNDFDVMLFSLADVSNTLVSADFTATDRTGNGGSNNARISPDGSTVAYQTGATDIVPVIDDNGASDLIVYDRQAGSSALASRTANGVPGNGPSRISFTTFNPQKLSDDGRYLIFESEATDLVAGVSGTASNIYLFDRTTQEVQLVSVAASGAGGGDGDSLQPVISADGQAAAWTSEATDLRDPADTNGQRDVYARLGALAGPTLTTADAMVTEGQSGTTPVTVEVTLDPAAAGEVTVDYATVDGTATAPSDYTATSGTLTFMPGQTSATVTVDVVGDPDPEGDETFTVALSNPTGGAVLGMPATATVTILDDDGAGAVDPREGVSDTIRILRQGDPNVTRDVALRYSQATFGPEGLADLPDEVLLATDAQFADALASGALQTTRSPEGMTTGGRPLLLTPTDQLSPSVAAEIQRLGATTVRILGGTAAISDAVAAELTGMGLTVERYAGPSRLETATDIAGQLFPQATTAILARAFPAEGAGDPTQAFADSLAAGAWAAARGWPLLLTQTEVLSTSTRTYLEGSAITTVQVVGGTAAIAESVLDELRALGITVERHAGPSRFDTALAIAAQRGYASEVDAPRVAVLDGQGPDSWAAGFAGAAYSALGEAPVLLGTTEVLPGPTADFLTGMGSAAAFAVDEGMITGPVLVCAIATERCDESRSLLGLPALATVELEQDGMSVPAGTTLTGTITNTVEGATLQPYGSCLPEVDPAGVPAQPDPVGFQLGLPQDAPEGPCDILFDVAFPNGSVQTVVTSITVTSG